jgi:hypothetical protein
MNYFASVFEFILNFNKTQSFSQEDVELSVALNTGATVKVYINEVKVIDMRPNSHLRRSIQCSSKETIKNYIDPVSAAITDLSCCQG